ncbi:MAG TPA: hypothetical protein VG604_01110 [Candidatus Saccharimonadales bacterium]|nr:hypothetical protein [Candidatus Saccharimonadales bacterium]
MGDKNPHEFGAKLTFDLLRHWKVQAAATTLVALLATDVAVIENAHNSEAQSTLCEVDCGRIALASVLPDLPDESHPKPHKHQAELPSPPQPQASERQPKHAWLEAEQETLPAKSSPPPKKPLQALVGSVLSLLDRPKMRPPVHHKHHHPAKPQQLNPLKDLAGKIGIDDSFPQCDNKSLATKDHQHHRAAVRVAGLNEISLPSLMTPCLGLQKGKIKVSELDWLKGTAPKNRMVYSFAINPGRQSPLWLQDDRAPCRVNGPESCYEEYGRDYARENIKERLEPNAKAVGLKLPKGMMVWIDVEGPDYYQQGSAKAKQNNQAVVSGMIAEYNRLGYNTGIYTLEREVPEIFGSIDPSSKLHEQPVWLPTHGYSPKYACTQKAPGLGETVMVQDQTVVHGEVYDHDTGC